MVFLAVFMTCCSYFYGKWRTPAQRWMPWVFCVFACLAALSTNWLSFLCFMELSSFALAAMVGKKDRSAAWMYLYSQLTGGALLLIAVAWASHGAIPFPMGPVPDRLAPLFVAALGFKTAMPILHFWLPITHGRAPAEVSAVLSGYAVKMGVYGLFRAVEGPSVLLLSIGTIMALYGVFQALMQHDGKRLLAYHTMSQLGFIVTALGTGTTLGRTAALFHMVAHCIFKGLLFLTAGGLEDTYGTRDLRFLGRAAKDVPILFLLFVIGAVSSAGVPGTSGYVSKVLIKASLAGYPSVMWALQFAGVGTVVYLCKFGFYGYLRPAGPCSGSLTATGRPGARQFKVMISMGTISLGIGFLHRWLPFFPKDGPELWNPGTIFAASLPIAIGIGLFVMFYRILSPRDGHFPDVEDILPFISRLCAELLSSIRRLHCGKLRFYLYVMILSVLSILWILSV